MRLTLLLPISSLAIASAAKNRYGSLPIIPQGLTPRYFLDKSHPLAKRDGSCGDGNHSCLEIGHGDRCCDNDSYCYINKDNSPKCCPIGSNCTNDSPCRSTAFYCTTTRTLTGAAAATETGCCDRACPQTSHYLCASSLGGNCCPFGSECQAGGNCIATKTAKPSQTPSLTPVVQGCTTSQYKCADGTGCCDNSQHCTRFDGTGYCAEGSPTSAASVPIEDSTAPGLSIGAKAGIAVGAVVGGGLIIGTAIWLFISKRRESGSSNGTSSRHNGGAPRAERAMTTVTASSQAWPPRGDDWAEPASGPFTETGQVSTSPVPDRAVPGQPLRPGDIAAPIEIGPGERREGHEAEPSSPKSPVSAFTELRRTETIEGRFELDGSEAPWTPTSPTLPNSHRDFKF